MLKKTNSQNQIHSQELKEDLMKPSNYQNNEFKWLEKFNDINDDE